MNTLHTDPRKPLPAAEPVVALDATLLELLPAAVCVCDARGLITRYNRMAAELWGRAPQVGDQDERFCGAWRLYRDGGLPLPHAETPLARALRTGQPKREAEIWIERPDDSRICVAVSADPVRDRNGTITGAVACLQEIAPRRPADGRAAGGRDLLRESERRLDDILQALPTPVYTTDAEGTLTFYNEAAAALWGQRPALGEARWCGSWRLYRPDGTPLPHDACPMALALRQGRPVRDVEAVAERPDGTRVPFMPFPTPLYDSGGTLTGAVNILVDISRHKEAEQRQQLLINELNHRVKNTLATVQSIATQTLRSAASADAARADFEARLLALSQAHDLLTRGLWKHGGLRALLVQEFAPYRSQQAERVRLLGQEVALAPRATLTLAMIMHELATNAAKYGALSAAEGSIEIAWLVEPDAAGRPPRLHLRWAERGGPPVAPPRRRGFGSRLLERGVRHDLQGDSRLEFLPDGLRCEIVFPLAGEPAAA